MPQDLTGPVVRALGAERNNDLDDRQLSFDYKTRRKSDGNPTERGGKPRGKGYIWSVHGPNLSKTREASEQMAAAAAAVLQQAADRWFAAMLERYPHRRETLELGRQRLLEQARF